MVGDEPTLTVADAADWRAWLEQHHEQRDGVWLVLAKKGTTEPTELRYEAALDEALCFGWIDGKARRGNDESVYIQRFTPRRARSRWSKRNVGHIARLESEGRVHPARRAEVERAKADGRWDAAYAAGPMPASTRSNGQSDSSACCTPPALPSYARSPSTPPTSRPGTCASVVVHTPCLSTR